MINSLGKIAFYFFIGFSFVLSGSPVYGDTYVSGNITTDTTWTKANSPYIVTGTVQIFSGVTLTIEPGVTAKFDDETGLTVGGQLIAIGTDSERIIFTSSKSSPSPEDRNWSGIKFIDSSIDAQFDENGTYLNGGIIKYCVIEYAYDAGIEINSASPYISFNKIQYNTGSDGAGISLKSSLSVIENNEISYNRLGGAIYCYKSSPTILGNIMSGNTGSAAVINLDSCSNTTVKNNNIVDNPRTWYQGHPTSENDGIFTYYSSAKIEGNIISNNGASNIFISPGSNITALWNELYSPELSINVFIGTIYPVTTSFHYNNITTTGNNYLFYLSGCPTDIDASYNWWGTTDVVTIDNEIWDYYDDITLGKVLYSPIASSPYDITIENSVSTPTPPSGPTSGTPGTSYTYSTGGSSSDHGHPPEYRFDWGDGTYSDWSSSASASKSWSATSTYLVKAQARCEIHTSIVSAWSESLSVNIFPLTYAISGTVTYNGPGLSGVTLTLSGSGSGSTTTDASGNYSFTGLSNGTYTITPSKSGYTFTPTSRTVTINGVNQTGINFTAAIVCTYTISPTSQSFNSNGGTGNVSVTTQSGCTWTATSNVSWVTVTSGNSGNSNGTVNYSVSANTSTSQRTGTLTIAGQTFTVIQQGISCTFTISPTSQSFSSSGGTGSVSVTTQSGCTWTATSNVSWITITSGSSGTGNGTVNYSVSHLSKIGIE